MIPQSGIYYIVNRTNGKMYIGSSVDLTDRWRHHRADLRAGRHRNPILQRAWLRHGEAGFTFTVLEYCQDTALLDREEWWICLLRSGARERGYNLNGANHSRLGRPHSEATKAKISLANRGYRHTEAARASIRAASSGRRHSAATRSRLAAMKTGKRFTVAHREALAAASRMRWQSPGEREKIAAFHRGRKQTDEHVLSKSKQYAFVSPEGTYIEVVGLRQFCRQHSLNAGHMAQVAQGREKQHKGWRLANRSA